MIREDVVNRTQALFRDIFDNHTLVIYDKMSALDIDEWDSLNQINLISAIQKEFKIKFELLELHELNNVGLMIDAILKKTNNECI
jgi:acyl carrier protein